VLNYTRLGRVTTAILGTLLITATLSVVAPGVAFARHDGNPDCPTGTYSGTYYGCQVGPSVSSHFDSSACFTANALWVCVQAWGDYVWVKDMQSDGHSAVAEIYTEDNLASRRICRNVSGYGTWAYCNFDWDDDHLYIIKGWEFEQNGSTWAGDWINPSGTIGSFYG
jgi:hypothetical protein